MTIRRAVLIVRLFLETIFGLLYISSLLLLPFLFRRFGATILIFGYLGAPHRRDGAMLTQTDLEQINYEALLVGLVLVSVLVATGLLWFKDTYGILQKLRKRGQ